MAGAVRRHHSAGDAFRALGAGDLVGHAAPAETPRRTVGDERGDLGRLGMRQEQQRARFRSGCGCRSDRRRQPCRRPAAALRRAREGDWPPARTAARSADRDAGAAYRSRRATLRVGRRSPVRRRCSSVCRAGIGSARVTARPTASKPKPASSRRRHRFELQIDEARHVGDVARRQRQRDIDRLDRAVDAIEGKPQRARADIVAREHVHERPHEPAAPARRWPPG